MNEATPIPSRDRIFTLDLIRGFALLGIFIMNMPWFNTSFYAEADGTKLWPAWWDQWTVTATDVLFAGKFNSMFSMLFAIGFLLQLERLERRDPAHATSIYLRRIFWLFVFGLVHMCVFWGGDVLHVYATFGLVLLGLRRAPTKVLWTLLALCLLFPVAMSVWRLMTFVPADRDAIIAMSRAWEATNNAAYGHGSFFAAMREHTREFLHLYTEPYELRRMASFYVLIFLTMLLGLLLGRARFFQDAGNHLDLVRRVQWWSLATGLATGLVYGTWVATTTDFITPTPWRLVAGICFWVSRVLIMMFYVATLVRCAHNEKWQARLAPIAVAGRMPLTNYLMQTLIATALFYGWGFGLWGKVGPLLDLVLAIAIFFVVQVPLSLWWMKRFDTGPMEYVWRRLTYGRATLKDTAQRSSRWSGTPAP